MFLIKWLERCLRLSDFGKGAWIALGLEAVFSRNMRKNTCSLVGGLIGFDSSSQGGGGPHILYSSEVNMRNVGYNVWVNVPWPSRHGKRRLATCCKQTT